MLLENDRSHGESKQPRAVGAAAGASAGAAAAGVGGVCSTGLNIYTTTRKQTSDTHT